MRAALENLSAPWQDQVEWQEREVMVMGRRVMQPRLVAYMADHSGLKYTYSGSCMVPSPWNDAVLEIKVANLSMWHVFSWDC